MFKTKEQRAISVAVGMLIVIVALLAGMVVSQKLELKDLLLLIGAPIGVVLLLTLSKQLDNWIAAGEDDSEEKR